MEWATAIAARLAPMRRARRWCLAPRKVLVREAALAASTKAGFSQLLPFRVGLRLFLSALRLFPGQTPAQVARGRELRHIGAHLRHDDLGGAPPDPGDGVHRRHRLLKRVHPPGHLLVQPPDLLLQVTEVPQLAGQQVALVRPHQPAQGLLQLLQLPPEPPPGQLRQHLRVLLPLAHRLKHGPPRGPQHVAGHRPQLDVGPLQQLLYPVGRPAALPGQAPGQAPPVAGQFPQLPLRALRDEAGLQQAATQQVGDPLGVPVSSTGQALHIGLAPRHRLHVPGIDHHHAELVLQYVVDRLPVDPGALHRHLGYLMARQPVGQGQQVLGHGGKAAHLLALRGDDAGRHPLLVHVQPAAPLVNGIHLPAPSVDGCRPAGDRRTRDFTMRALRRGGATFLDAWRSPRQFPARARSANDGRPSRRPAPPHFHPLRWPSQGHGISGESRNPRIPRTGTLLLANARGFRLKAGMTGSGRRRGHQA